MSARLVRVCVLLIVLAPVSAGAITLGQIDDFEDGGSASWVRGSNSTNPPANMASGGPGGADDNYLHQISTGTGLSDSRMVMFNEAQWTGDYESAGVAAIRMMVNNLGVNTLHLRVALTGAPFETKFVSTEAVIVPPASGWIQIVLSLSEGDLERITGNETLSQVLADVDRVRLLSAVGGFSDIGDKVEGILGIDDIEAIAVAVPTEESSVSSMKSAWD